jgi:hypothetical protein
MRKLFVALLLTVSISVFADGYQYFLSVSIPGPVNSVYLFNNYYGDASEFGSFLPLFKEQAGVIFKAWVGANAEKLGLPVSDFRRVNVNNGSVTWLAVDLNGKVLCHATTLWKRVNNPKGSKDFSMDECPPYDQSVLPNGFIVYRNTQSGVEPLPIW